MGAAVSDTLSSKTSLSLHLCVCVCVNNMFLSFCCIFSFLSLKEKELSF